MRVTGSFGSLVFLLLFVFFSFFCFFFHVTDAPTWLFATCFASANDPPNLTIHLHREKGERHT